MSHSTERESFFSQFISELSEIAIDGGSGALAGFLSTFIFHPLENARTRLQDYDSGKKSNANEDKKVSLLFIIFKILI